MHGNVLISLFFIPKYQYKGLSLIVQSCKYPFLCMLKPNVSNGLLGVQIESLKIVIPFVGLRDETYTLTLNETGLKTIR